jgi:hypothetical protein
VVPKGRGVCGGLEMKRIKWGSYRDGIDGAPCVDSVMNSDSWAWGGVSAFTPRLNTLPICPGLKLLLVSLLSKNLKTGA